MMSYLKCKRADARKLGRTVPMWTAVILMLFACWIPVWGEGGEKEKAAETSAEKAKEENATKRAVSRETFEKLPRAKGLESILGLLPGIVWDNTYGAPSIDGASPPENRYFVEGVDTTGLVSGAPGMRVHTDFIESVKVSSPGAGAALGGYTGGAVDVIIREGGNKFHGSVGLYYQGSALEGKNRPTLRVNPFDNSLAEYVTYPQDTWNRFEPVITLGGYIIKDRLWFFSGFAPSFTTTERDGSDWPVPGGTIFYGDDHISGSNLFTRKDRRYSGTLKLTGQLSKSLRFSAHGLLDTYRWKGELPRENGLSNPEIDFAAHSFRFPTLSFGTTLEYAVSENFRVRADLGYFRRAQRESGVAEGATKIHVGNTANIPGIPEHLIFPQYWGRWPWMPSRVEKNLETSFSTGIHLDWDVNLAGRHALKAGFLAVRNGIEKDSGWLEDVYTFHWNRDYLRADGTEEQTTYGYVEVRDPYGYDYDIDANRYVLYIQDTWTLERFSLTLGLRARQEEIPAFVEGYGPPVSFGFGDTLAPRAAFNWSPLEDGSLQVFGGFGIYYDSPKLEWAENFFGGFRGVFHYYDIADWDWKDSYYDMEHPLTNGLAGGRHFESRDRALPDFEHIQPGLKPMGKREFTLGVRKDIGRDWTASAVLLHHALFNPTDDTYIPASDNMLSLYLVNPGSDWLQRQYEEAGARGYMPAGIEAAKAKRTYTAVTLRLDKRFSHRWLGGLSYTWSRLHGNYDGVRHYDDAGYRRYHGAPTFDMWYQSYNQRGTGADGLLSADRTHRLKLYGAYTFDFGLTLGLHASGMSGTPLQTELYLNGDRGFYPLGRGGEGRTPFLWQLDLYAEYNLRLSDRWTLQFNADVTNVTDNDMARRKHMHYNDAVVYMTEQKILDGFDYAQVISEKGAHLDPRYGMEYDYLDAIAARLGVKLMF